MNGIVWNRGELQQFFNCVIDGLEDEVLRPVAKYASTRISARATRNYMRRAALGPRSPNDNGPLRIQTSRLARSLTGSEFHGGGGREAINEIKIRRGKMTYTKGSRVPYALVHEKGTNKVVRVRPHTRNGAQVRGHDRRMNIKKRAYLVPALNDSVDEINRETLRLADKHVGTCMRRIGK